MEMAKVICRDIDAEFKKVFGRHYGLVSPYLCEDADLILVTAGTIAGTCRVVADRFRAKGMKVGVLRIRMFRPFPGKQICESLRGAQKVAVIDRDFSPGCGGIIAQEVKAALQGFDSRLPVYEFIAGLGGMDVTDKDIERIIEQTHNMQNPGESTWIGLLK
jgi:pyruvate/2-oxoacid:ferredoxin oxidoreductase alpha subunit